MRKVAYVVVFINLIALAALITTVIRNEAWQVMVAAHLAPPEEPGFSPPSTPTLYHATLSLQGLTCFPSYLGVYLIFQLTFLSNTVRLWASAAWALTSTILWWAFLVRWFERRAEKRRLAKYSSPETSVQ